MNGSTTPFLLQTGSSNYLQRINDSYSSFSPFQSEVQESTYDTAIRRGQMIEIEKYFPVGSSKPKFTKLQRKEAKPIRQFIFNEDSITKDQSVAHLRHLSSKAQAEGSSFQQSVETMKSPRRRNNQESSTSLFRVNSRHLSPSMLRSSPSLSQAVDS